MPEKLAPIMVNNERVRVGGDPKPTVAKIVEFCGKQPDLVEVFRLHTPQDAEGKRLTLEEYIDRAAEPNPIWLKLMEHTGGAGTGGMPTAQSSAPRQPMGKESTIPSVPPPSPGPQPPTPGSNPSAGRAPEERTPAGSKKPRDGVSQKEPQEKNP